MNGCLNISVQRVGKPVSFTSGRDSLPMIFSVEEIDFMSFFSGRIDSEVKLSAERVGEPISYGAQRKGKPLEFRCGLVCSVSWAFYLNVEPECIWLLPENDFSEDVVVYSNVTWTIE